MALSKRALVLALFCAAGAASAASAQRIWVGGEDGFGGRRGRPRFAKPSDFDGRFMYCRGYYESRWRERGGGSWGTDYPGADNNFSIRLAELTRVSVKFDPDGQPHYIVVPLTDPLLYRCPMLFMEGVGSLEFSPEEVQRLREFFLKGGFLLTDDEWGSAAWASWAQEIGRVLPPSEFPMVDVPMSHPIMHTLYDVKEIPQVSNISFWYQNGGRTSERGRDSAQVFFRGIMDSKNRIMVLSLHNTDIADTWEREGANSEFFDLFSPKGYAIGVNILLYAMTH
jgi:hypothetical protein